MMIWQRHLDSHIIRRIVIGLILGLALGMVPVTLFLVKQELIARAGETVALGAADIADKLDIVLAERLGDMVAGNVVAALGACLQEFRALEGNCAQAVQELVDTATLISRELGFKTA